MDRISRTQVGMLSARLQARRGTCNRLQVGAVVEVGGRIVAGGYNGAPAGAEHCNHVDKEPCTRAIHAEANLIAYAAREGIKIGGGILYCTDSPCISCAQLIVASGIVGLYYEREYRIKDGLNYLTDHGLWVQQKEYPHDV